MKLPTRLETKRTFIRKFREADLAGFKKFMQDGQAAQYLLFFEKQKTFKGIIELFDSIIHSYTVKMDFFSLAVADKIKTYTYIYTHMIISKPHQNSG